MSNATVMANGPVSQAIGEDGPDKETTIQDMRALLFATEKELLESRSTITRITKKDHWELAQNLYQATQTPNTKNLAGILDLKAEISHLKDTLSNDQELIRVLESKYHADNHAKLSELHLVAEKENIIQALTLKIELNTSNEISLQNACALHVLSIQSLKAENEAVADSNEKQAKAIVNMEQSIDFLNQELEEAVKQLRVYTVKEKRDSSGKKLQLAFGTIEGLNDLLKSVAEDKEQLMKEIVRLKEINDVSHNEIGSSPAVPPKDSSTTGVQVPSLSSRDIECKSTPDHDNEVLFDIDSEPNQGGATNELVVIYRNQITLLGLEIEDMQQTIDESNTKLKSKNQQNEILENRIEKQAASISLLRLQIGKSNSPKKDSPTLVSQTELDQSLEKIAQLTMQKVQLLDQVSDLSEENDRLRQLVGFIDKN